MNDVVFENLLCDAAAQLREERLEKIKLPHKNQHILRAFAVCVCAAILSLSVVYAVPSMRAQLFSLLQIEEESDWILRFESQTQTANYNAAGIYAELATRRHRPYKIQFE